LDDLLINNRGLQDKKILKKEEKKEKKEEEDHFEFFTN
jgi:hypothetical protein